MPETPYVLFGALGAIMAAFIAGITTWYVTRLRDRVNRSYNYFFEFNSPEMTEIRQTSLRLLKDNSGMTARQIFRSGIRDGHKIFTLISFFQALEVSVRRKDIHKPLVRMLFAPNIIVWYLLLNGRIDHDQSGKPTSEQSDIQNLFDFVTQTRTARIEQWQAYGKDLRHQVDFGVTAES